MLKLIDRCYQLFYTGLLWLALPGLLAVQLLNVCRLGFAGWQRLQQRAGLYPLLASSPRQVIWFHGSSLGEVKALIPLMERFKSQQDACLILSVMTERGEVIARKQSPADYVCYLPFDYSFLVRKALRRVAPAALVIVETEIWPNLFWESYQQQVPVIVVSGRISERSFPRYSQLRFFFRRVLSQAHLLMRSEQDEQRMRHIAGEKAKIACVGDIKYDSLKTFLNAEERERLADLPFSPEDLLWVAGSTHSGEEEILLDAFQEIKKDFPELRLVIAPRHLKRLPEVMAAIDKKGLRSQRRSQSSAKKHHDFDVLVLDTYGELSLVYAWAELVFIGGSLVPVGGHNVMEAAALGKAVLIGPHWQNFRRQVQILQEQEAILVVEDKEELVSSCYYLLSQPEERQKMGQRGQEIMRKNQGSINRCVAYIQEVMTRPSFFSKS